MLTLLPPFVLGVQLGEEGNTRLAGRLSIYFVKEEEKEEKEGDDEGENEDDEDDDDDESSDSDEEDEQDDNIESAADIQVEDVGKVEAFTNLRSPDHHNSHSSSRSMTQILTTWTSNLKKTRLNKAVVLAFLIWDRVS